MAPIACGVCWIVCCAPSRTRHTLTVSAAISLKDSLEQINNLYGRERPGVKIDYNFGGSGSLAQQIEQGAPVDIYISASPLEMNALSAAHLLAGDTRRDLLSNEIVLVTPANHHGISGFHGLTGLEVAKFAIGDPDSVPAGQYSKQVLDSFGLYDKLRPKIIFTKDVRQVLTYVATGNVDAGLVYQTDAYTTHDIRIVAAAPPGSHAPIIYSVAVLQNSRDRATALDFEGFLLGTAARQVFRNQGFRPLE